MSENENELVFKAERRSRPRSVNGKKGRKRSGFITSRRVPFVRLTVFYLILIGVATLAMHFVPLVRHAWISSPVIQGGGVFDRDSVVQAAQDPVNLRAISVLIITIGALALSLPIAWVYTFTRRLTYDASLVHSVIILPMVISGIIVIVKDSIALAFGLAGIVAAVRFRNTLKDPKDAVYIFLAIGIGLAAGVQAVDVALVMSIVFNTVVLVLWKYNIAAMYGEMFRDILTVGDPELMIARGKTQRQKIRAHVASEAPDMEVDGILLVHAPDQELAKQRIEISLGPFAKDWRIVDNIRQQNGVGTFLVMLRFKKDEEDPLELLADIDERWSREVAAAEYLPFKKPVEKAEDDDDDDADASEATSGN